MPKKFGEKYQTKSRKRTAASVFAPPAKRAPILPQTTPYSYAYIQAPNDRPPVDSPSRRTRQTKDAVQQQQQPPTSAAPWKVSCEQLTQALCEAIAQLRHRQGNTADFVAAYRRPHRAIALALCADLSAGRVAGQAYPQCARGDVCGAIIYLLQMAIVSGVLAEFLIQRIPIACVLGVDALVEIADACKSLAHPPVSVARQCREVLFRRSIGLRETGRGVDGAEILAGWMESLPCTVAGTAITETSVREWGNGPLGGGHGDTAASPAGYYVPFQAALVAYAGANLARPKVSSPEQVSAAPAPLVPVLCGGYAYIPNRHRNNGLLLRCAIQLLRSDLREVVDLLRRHVAGDAVDPEAVSCIIAEAEAPDMSVGGEGGGSSSSLRDSEGLPFATFEEAAMHQGPITATLFAATVSMLPILGDARAILVDLGVYTEASSAATTMAAGVEVLDALHADPLKQIDKGTARGSSGGGRLWPQGRELEARLRLCLAGPSLGKMEAVLGALGRAVAPCVLNVAIQAATIKDAQALPGQKFGFERWKFLKGRLAVSGVTPETAQAVVDLLQQVCKTKDKASERQSLDPWIWRGLQPRRSLQTEGTDGDGWTVGLSGLGCRRIRTDLPGVCAFVPGADGALSASGVEAIRRVLGGTGDSAEAGLARVFGDMRTPAKYAEAVEACVGSVDIEAADVPLWSKRDQFAGLACYDCLGRVRNVRGWRRVGHPQMYTCESAPT